MPQYLTFVETCSFVLFKTPPQAGNMDHIKFVAFNFYNKKMLKWQKRCLFYWRFRALIFSSSCYMSGGCFTEAVRMKKIYLFWFLVTILKQAASYDSCIQSGNAIAISLSLKKNHFSVKYVKRSPQRSL